MGPPVDIVSEDDGQLWLPMDKVLQKLGPKMGGNPGPKLGGL